MKFNIGNHLQEIGSHHAFDAITVHGYVVDTANIPDVDWYLIENDELGLVNHWVPENKLEFHKQTLREGKLKELGI